LQLEHLVAIRAGELVVYPLESAPRWAEAEFLKLRGGKGGWCCCFFDQESGSCGIYAQRPMECRVLACWEPGPLLAVAGKGLLSRGDLLEKDHRLRAIAEEYDRLFPALAWSRLLRAVLERPGDLLLREEVDGWVRRDLAYREGLAARGVSVGEELFALGRPLWLQLACVGLESDSGKEAEGLGGQ